MAGAPMQSLTRPEFDLVTEGTFQHMTRSQARELFYIGEMGVRNLYILSVEPKKSARTLVSVRTPETGSPANTVRHHQIFRHRRHTQCSVEAPYPSS